MKVYHDDAWRYTKEPEKPEPTRAQEQSRINALFATGRIERREWRAWTDQLSEPTKWLATGRIA